MGCRPPPWGGGGALRQPDWWTLARHRSSRALSAAPPVQYLPLLPGSMCHSSRAVSATPPGQYLPLFPASICHSSRAVSATPPGQYLPLLLTSICRSSRAVPICCSSRAVYVCCSSRTVSAAPPWPGSICMLLLPDSICRSSLAWQYMYVAPPGQYLPLLPDSIYPDRRYPSGSAGLQKQVRCGAEYEANMARSRLREMA